MKRHDCATAGYWLPGCLAAALATGTALAQAPAEEGTGAPAVDTSDWKCKFCEFETGTSASLDLGAGYLSEDSFKFGEHTGLREKSGFLALGADVRWRDEEAGYFDLSATDFGFDATAFTLRRTLEVEGGRQGSYGLHLRYDEIPHFVSDSGETPYSGAGTADLDLPAGWVRAGSTAGMSALASSLRSIELDTERRRAEAGAAFVLGSNWDFGVNVRREEREGRQRTAGAFFFNAAQLIQPVDYVTDEVEAFAGYSRSDWQLRVAYLGSMFENRDSALTWDNPFTALAAGADTGQLALPPDNEFHQVRLSAGYDLSEATRVSGDLALGRMEQNEAFLAATTNAGLAVAPLPRSSLDGRVDTTNAALRVSSRVSRALRLNADWRRDERDNRTPQASYPVVTTDTFIGAARTNLPYSFTQNALGVSADYRLAPGAKLSAGAERETIERSFQEVRETRERSLWGKLALRPAGGATASVRVARERRDVSSYDPVAEIQPPQNPLLRKYNLADRDRDALALRGSTPLADGVDVGLGLSVANDSYGDSEVGLTGARETGLDADLSMQVSADTSLHLFFAQQLIESRQAGSNAFAGADWFASVEDTVNTAGLGVQRRGLMETRLDIGADYTVSNSRGAISVAGAPFPDLETTLHTVKLHASYRLESGHTLYGAWWYETYDAKDWALDALAPGSIPGVLTLGEETPSYSLHVFMLALRYRF